MLSGIAFTAGAATRSPAEAGQLRSSLTWIAGTRDAAGRVRWYAGQRTPDGTLVLTPNQSYFLGSLTATGRGPAGLPLAAWNKNRSFRAIAGWNSPEDAIRWHLWFVRTGLVRARVFLDVAAQQAGASVTVQLGDEDLRRITVPAEGEETAQPWKLVFTVRRTGLVTLTLRGVPSAPRRAIARFVKLELRGAAVADASVLRSRWRPAAIHSGAFTSRDLQRNGGRSSLWIMQIRPELGVLGAYAPITTPFGYFGSPFDPDGSVRMLNFSMWSYSRHQSAPPVARLSHLLALGSPKARFGGFNDEGTGVKPLGWNPFVGLRVREQFLALRVVRGTPYDTYYGYYLDPRTQDWRLYAIGRKYVSRRQFRNESLTPGAFVEVPGMADRQRTGDVSREVDFRGWVCDEHGAWHRLDTMAGPARVRGRLNQTWGVTTDGWFSLRMGGMAYYEFDGRAGRTRLPRRFIHEPRPPCMAPDKLRQLDAVPVSVTLPPAKNIRSTAAVIPVTVDQHGATGTLTLYWGPADQLTFAGRWPHSRSHPGVGNGRVNFSVDHLRPATKYYYRALLVDRRCRIWSFTTGALVTPPR